TYDRSDQMSDAYREVQARIGERQLIDGTQIVEIDPIEAEEIALSQEQEVSFRANVREGNSEAAASIVSDLFTQRRTLPATAALWHRFAERIEERIRQAAEERIAPSQIDEIFANAAERVS